MLRRNRLPLALAVSAIAAVAVGAVVFMTHKDSYLLSGGVGYSSYAPLDTQTTFSSGGVLWTGTAVGGLTLLAAGLVLLAAVVGFLIGRRRPSSEPSQ